MLTSRRSGSALPRCSSDQKQLVICAPGLRNTIPMLSDVIATLVQLKNALDRAGIDYMVVGSLASSAHGLPRATRDADLVVTMTRQQVNRLVATLRPKFYVSEDAAVDAIQHSTSFNAIHEETFYQVDLFVVKPTPFNRAQFDRREDIEVDPEHHVTMPFQSAEDTILSKLDWFRQGQEVSERQWGKTSWTSCAPRESSWITAICDTGPLTWVSTTCSSAQPRPTGLKPTDRQTNYSTSP
jgi:hypothetical protein